MIDFVKLRELMIGSTPLSDEHVDIYNFELLNDLNSVSKSDESGIQKMTSNDKNYLIYIKDGKVVSAVNCDDIEEYAQHTYTLSPYLNVLFRELGSDKIVRLGMDSESIHEDDIYSLYDSFSDYKKCFDWMKKD
jgi:hypothetical protein